MEFLKKFNDLYFHEQLLSWVIIGLIFIVGLIFRKPVKFIIRKVAYLMFPSFVKNLSESERMQISEPIAWTILSLLWTISLEFIDTTEAQYNIIHRGVGIIFTFSFIILLIRVIYLFTSRMESLLMKEDIIIDKTMVPVITKVIKVIAIIIIVLIGMQNLGVNLMSLIAGLGLGGLAFALAAKDTVSNLFGSMMIIIDKPFKVGDWVIMNDVEGYVEEIGFRSTRIRTFYNSLVSMPNSIVANIHIDNMGKRKFRRVKFNMGITYDTTPDKIEKLTSGIKKIINDMEESEKDNCHVVFNEFSDFSLNILVYFFIHVDSYADELLVKEKLLLSIHTLARKTKINFAFPTSTVHISRN